MPKLNETFARSTKFASEGTQKHWDTEIRGFVLFVGKRSKTWYYQRDVAGKTVRKKIGSYPIIGAAAARQAAQAHALDLSRGSGKVYQRGAPTLGAALESYLARPKLRSNVRKAGVKSQMERHLGDWLGLLFEQNDEWQTQHRYMQVEAFASIDVAEVDPILSLETQAA